MTYKQLETAREVRLWVTQLVVPIITVGGTIIAASPEIRQSVIDKFTKTKEAVVIKFKKVEKD